MPHAGSKILSKMLERLFAAIVSGPSLNCRPHNSRQRLDLVFLDRFRDLSPPEGLRAILSDAASATFTARVPPPPARVLKGRSFSRRSSSAATDPALVEPVHGAPPSAVPAMELTPEESAAHRAWLEQQAILTKLRVLVDDARTYEADTGVYVLNLGFPLLSLPPGIVIGRQPGSRRVLAPIAFIPVSVTVRAGAAATVEIACKADEIDRVAPNEALLAWLEQQVGKRGTPLFADEEGANPWKEITSIVSHVAAALGTTVPAAFSHVEMPERTELLPAPRADEAGDRPAILSSAVLGLFPLSNQGLLNDTRAMIEIEPAAGPVRSFLRADVSMAVPEPAKAAPESQPAPADRRIRRAAEERLVAAADPCQARAVAMARTSAGLVVHGPPGTGKSQTITNIIGDHLARGERVLFVCDKRTALDVVANRMEHLGLGSLSAVIHDPQRDQRDLYMSVRDQLETLPETKTAPRAEASVAKLSEELTGLHSELAEIHRGLAAGEGGDSLHSLVGEWLALAPVDGSGPADASEARSASMGDLEASGVAIREVLDRAAGAGYATNPWFEAAGVRLGDIVSRPMDEFRSAMGRCVDAAAGADRTLDPSIPPFDAGLPLDAQASAREGLAEELARVLPATPPEVRTLWASRDADQVRLARRALDAAAPALNVLRRVPPDLDLLATIGSTPPSAQEIARRIGVLDAYLHKSSVWYGFALLGRTRPAAEVLRPLGLPVTAVGAERARAFHEWLRAARVVADTLDRYESKPSSTTIPDPETLDRFARSHRAVLDLLSRTNDEPALRGLAAAIGAAVRAGGDAPETRAFLHGLRLSRTRATTLSALEAACTSSRMLDAPWLATRCAVWRKGEAACALIGSLRDRLGTLEDVLRVRDGLGTLPSSLSEAVRSLVAASVESGEGLRLLRRAVLTGEIGRRLEADTRLRALDARRMQTLLDRCLELEEQRREKVRDAILHRWVGRQRERLLASTGTRLSTTGADVRRRLTTRGRRAMRLRQVLALGRGMEGGDPLLDLRPVWMASPETVAQIFPREPLFGAVVFDEASQCRLEEALPVLTRGARVVIAGDPKQLPPTRFFETVVASSEQGGAIETDQDLFEHQQGEVEDLLTAALGLDIEQSYLDVHYRSRNSDLIAFSNNAFYGSRLQPIPGHPRNRARFAPITLYRAGGVYRDGTNDAEAAQVVRIVHDLLRRAEPPTIGIACFNIDQRDLIMDRLEQAADQDGWFSRALAAARSRKGESSFEGLFVKNLENVQGDERDHIIISTTYGPDPSGKFYRRFGPLGMPGGGRRLNVLVTRAKQEVHLVTSIPPEAYRSVPPVPPGQTPGGGWLLFAYLRFAEELGGAYEARRAALERTEPVDAVQAGASPDPERHVTAAPQAECTVQHTRSPSPVAAALGEGLAAHGVGSVIHWGNEGFCVDLATCHPDRPDDVSVGVLCDFNRFPLADDPIEWELFRSAILASQGWTLQRVWSPVLFRDARGSIEAVLARHKAAGTRSVP